MKIGEIIRKHRKIQNLTQEEMANRLGVTAPAVNKWENGNSLPDILLLAPIARLLKINLDTLLSFQEQLTAEEIKQLIYEVDNRFKVQSYDEVFQWAKTIVAEYPNCPELLLQFAAIFDVKRLTDDIDKPEKYDSCIISWYICALESDNETTRSRAADSLFGFYWRKKEYDKAEGYLSYFSIQNPERKRKQAQIYSSTGDIPKAYQALEDLLFSDCQHISMVFHDIYLLAMQENNFEKAHILVEKMQVFYNLFDMGKYHEASCRLELATAEKDADTLIEIMQQMLENLSTITDFKKSPLYEHMEFQEPSEEFLTELKQDLIKCFQDNESYSFLINDDRRQKLLSHYS